MYNSKKIKKSLYKNRKTQAIVVILLLIAIVVTIEISSKTGVFNPSNMGSTSPNHNGIDSNINFNPPTESELQAGNKQKQEIINQAQKPLPVTAKVVIVDSSQYKDTVEVRAFTANVVKDGKCIITFSKGNYSFSKEVEAIADASSTPCMSLTIPVSEFNESGIWTVMVDYKSSDTSGSEQSQLEIIR